MKSHMIFGVNIDSAITIMARFFVDGHKFDTPTSMTYTSILSKQSVKVVLMLADLNGHNVKCSDVHNSYINSKTKEIVQFWNVREFGVHKGKVVIVVRSLSGMKGAGSAWSLALRKIIRDLVFFPFRAFGDVQIRISIDASNIGAITNAGLPAVERHYE